MNTEQRQYLDEADTGTTSILTWAYKSQGPVTAEELELIWDLKGCSYLKQHNDSTRQRELDRLKKFNQKRKATGFHVRSQEGMSNHETDDRTVPD